MNYIFYIIISIIIAITLTITRPLFIFLNKEERNTTLTAVTLMFVVYGLLLGFSINNFYNRYIEIRNLFINEVTNLQIIYRTFKQLSNTEYVTNSILSYLKKVETDSLLYLRKKKYNPDIDILYKQMDENIINYLATHNTSFAAPIINKMTTSQQIKRLLNEIEVGNYYISVLIFLFVIVLIPLWLSSISDRILQFMLDLCIILIVMTSLYLCSILNNPFESSPISLKLTSYTDLINEIEQDKKNE